MTVVRNTHQPHPSLSLITIELQSWNKQTNIRLHLHGRCLQALPVPHSRVGRDARFGSIPHFVKEQSRQIFPGILPTISEMRNTSHLYLLFCWHHHLPDTRRFPSVRSSKPSNLFFTWNGDDIYRRHTEDTDQPYMAVVCVYPFRRIGARNRYQTKELYFPARLSVPGWVGNRHQERWKSEIQFPLPSLEFAMR
jgi:hypothetical protein